MTEGGDVDEIGIARIDEYCSDLLCVAQSEVSPGLSTVGRFVNAVPCGKIRALQSFAAADVDRFRFRWRDRDRADRPGWLNVEDRFPRVAVIGRFPNAAVVDAYIRDVWLAGNAGGADCTAAAERANHAPLHRRGEINLCMDRDTEKEQAEKGTRGEVKHRG